MSEHKRSVRGTRRGDQPTPHPTLLGLTALLLEIASKSSGSTSTRGGIHETAPLVSEPDALGLEGAECSEHVQREVSR
jgi:hypothetical protein